MEVRNRFVLLFLAIILVVFPIAVGSAQKRIVRLTFYYPVGVSGPLASVINTYVNEFNSANSDIEVVPVYTGDYDPTMQKVQTAVMGGNPPDVFIVEISELPTLLAMNACEPLDRFANKEYLSDFYPAFLENSYGQDGQLYNIPFQRSTPVFYWNKDHFREAGLDPNQPPRNWQETEDFARKLMKTDASGQVARWGVTISGGWNDWLFEAFVIQNGSTLLDYRDQRVSLNSAEALEALEFWVKLTNTLKIAPRTDGLLRLRISWRAEHRCSTTQQAFSRSSGRPPNLTMAWPSCRPRRVMALLWAEATSTSPRASLRRTSRLPGVSSSS